VAIDLDRREEDHRWYRGRQPRQLSRNFCGFAAASFGATGSRAVVIDIGRFGMKKWSFVALLLVGATMLGATVLNEPIANAAQTVSANIIGPLDPNGNVKVHEQGTAAVHEQGTAAVNVTNSSVPVHEQGTADVNVTNSSLSLAPPAPVTDGGNFASLAGGEVRTLAAPATAIALAIHLTSGVREVVLSLGVWGKETQFGLAARG
jgi:hypothetical protein